MRRTPDGEAATKLILSTFRTNGLLLEAGNEYREPVDFRPRRAG
jgi:hypothetical protein